MTKILLVEDDKSLREIYGVRLFAEGYDVVSAGDGEKALAVAIKERPALIITDVMMPKISGFDMLDILRSTTETKDIKVIVMTALGSEDNRERGERLGADKYLVKSQVGIEDVVREVHNLLGDQPAPQPTVQMPAQQPPASAAMMPNPSMGMNPGMPPGMGTPGTMPSAFPRPSTQNVSDVPSRRPRVIQPINDKVNQVDIQALVDKELAKEGSPVSTTAQQRQVVNSQLNTFSNQPTPAPQGASATPQTGAVPNAGASNTAAAPALPQPVPPAAQTTPSTAAPTAAAPSLPSTQAPPQTTQAPNQAPPSSAPPATPAV